MVDRDLGDLTEQEWQEATTAAKAANAAVTDDTVLVRSHVWPQPTGVCDWHLYVPGTLHDARGTAASLPAAYTAMNDVVRSWYPELTSNPDGVDAWMNMVRLRRD